MTTTTPEARRFPAGTGETLFVLGDRVTLRGPVAGAELVIADVSVPPGGGTPPHSHASPETFRVLSGAPVFLVAGGEVAAGPGDVIHVPPGALHAYRNPGPSVAEFTVAIDSALVAFFRDLATPEPLTGPPDAGMLARVAAAAKRHGIRIAEPV